MISTVFGRAAAAAGAAPADKVENGVVSVAAAALSDAGNEAQKKQMKLRQTVVGAGGVWLGILAANVYGRVGGSYDHR